MTTEQKENFAFLAFVLVIMLTFAIWLAPDRTKLPQTTVSTPPTTDSFLNPEDKLIAKGTWVCGDSNDTLIFTNNNHNAMQLVRENWKVVQQDGDITWLSRQEPYHTLD
jgi:hypothetical protein